MRPEVCTLTTQPFIYLESEVLGFRSFIICNLLHSNSSLNGADQETCFIREAGDTPAAQQVPDMLEKDAYKCFLLRNKEKLPLC
jgi:hypothetical protein